MTHSITEATKVAALLKQANEGVPGLEARLRELVEESGLEPCWTHR